MKKIIFGLLILNSLPTYATESKVICEGSIRTSLDVSKGLVSDEINSKISTLSKEGFTSVSAPSVSIGPYDGSTDSSNHFKIHTIICVTVTKLE